MADIREKNILDSLKTSDLPVLVEVFNSDCQDCEMLEPELIQVAKDFEGRIKTRRIDGEVYPELLMTWGIKEFPTLLFFVNGLLEWKHEGILRIDQLIRKIEETN